MRHHYLQLHLAIFYKDLYEEIISIASNYNALYICLTNQKFLYSREN